MKSKVQSKRYALQYHLFKTYNAHVVGICAKDLAVSNHFYQKIQMSMFLWQFFNSTAFQCMIMKISGGMGITRIGEDEVEHYVGYCKMFWQECDKHL